MNLVPKVVFSASGGVDAASRRALENATLNRARAFPTELTGWRDARVVVGDLVEEVARLKRESGDYVLALGGVRLARSLLAQELCDELRLLVHPGVLGQGLPLFDDQPAPRGLTLVESTFLESGAMALVYRAPARPSAIAR